MRIHVGCELSFEFSQSTPMIVMLNVHFSRFSEGAPRPSDHKSLGSHRRLSRRFWKLVQPPHCTRESL
jgi:hypothetical protein